jgi:2,5-diketo-D-gluconate reductase A
MTVPSLTLNNGITIPQIGLGTSPLTDDEVERTVITATGLGYRHIDTAAKYENEVGVGRGIRRSGIDRAELFVTTKLDGGYQGDDRAIAGLDACLKRLDLDYVDLLLIHWPLRSATSTSPHGGPSSSWSRSVRHGRSASPPSSQYLDRLLTEATILPVVNQIQLNPRITRNDQVAYHRAHGIVTTAWSPLGSGSGLRDDPTLAALAAKYDKKPAQIILESPWFGWSLHR